MVIVGLQASWLIMQWTTISPQPHTHLPNSDFATKLSSKPVSAYPKKYQPPNTNKMPHHADFPSWRLKKIFLVNLFHGKA